MSEAAASPRRGGSTEMGIVWLNVSATGAGGRCLGLCAAFSCVESGGRRLLTGRGVGGGRGRPVGSQLGFGVADGVGNVEQVRNGVPVPVGNVRGAGGRGDRERCAKGKTRLRRLPRNAGAGWVW